MPSPAALELLRFFPVELSLHNFLCVFLCDVLDFLTELDPASIMRIFLHRQEVVQKISDLLALGT